MNRPVFVVRVETTRAVARGLGRRAVFRSPCTAIWRSAERDVVHLEQYLASRADARHAAQACRTALQRIPRHLWRLTWRRLSPRDWSRAWQRHFRAQQVAPRIWIVPAWQKTPSQCRGIVIRVDPGMSFGTGEHPTTRGCLQLLDRLGDWLRGRSVLDLGCGSGILAIAAVRLGCANALALDHDPVAVRTTRRNCRRQGISGRVRTVVADVCRLPLRATFELVTANLLSGPLQRHAAAIARAVACQAGSRLILSGVLREQYAAVRRRYRKLGFREEQTVRLGPWVSACLSRP